METFGTNDTLETKSFLYMTSLQLPFSIRKEKHSKILYSTY